MNAKKSLLLIFIMLTCAAIACDIPALGQNTGSSQGGNSQPASGSPRVQPTFPPTYTPTPTLQPTATSTPGEAVQPTSEFSPTPTSTPPPAGWMAHGVLGFHIILPERWNVLEEQFAGDTVKFEAEDSDDEGIWLAGITVQFQYQYGIVDVEDVCTEVRSYFEALGIQIEKSECNLEINGLPAGRLTVREVVYSQPVKEYIYFYADGTRIWVVSLYVDESDWSRYQSTFVTIGESFVLD
jgi:hypothetical protein